MGMPKPGAYIPPMPDPAAAANRSRLITYLVIGAIILALLGGGALLKLGGSPSPVSLNAKGVANTPVMSVRGAEAPPVLAQGATSIAMPADVRDWLEHLAKVEQEKRRISHEQEIEMTSVVGQLMGTGVSSVAEVNNLSDPNGDISKSPHNDIMQSMTDRFKKKWYDLSAMLDSKPAPAECEEIRVSYDQALNQMGGAMSDLAAIVDSLDVSKGDANASIGDKRGQAEQIGRDHSAVIDENFKKADVGVQTICDKYKTSKWFSIDTNGSGANILSVSGGQ